jgi:hypothetical protein
MESGVGYFEPRSISLQPKINFNCHSNNDASFQLLMNFSSTIPRVDALATVDAFSPH